MDVTVSAVADTRAETANPDWKACRRCEPLRFPLGVFVGVDECDGRILQAFDDGPGAGSGNAAGADEEELFQAGASPRERENTPRAFDIDFVQLRAPCRKPGVGGGMDDDIDLADQTVPIGGVKGKIRLDNVARDEHQATGLRERRAQFVNAPIPSRARAKQHGQERWSERAAGPGDKHSSAHVSAPAAGRTSSTRIRK
jgi:hypothetical protein